jgi:uncharacterized protein (TIGR02466 family)
MIDIRGATIPSASLGIGLVASGHRPPQPPDRIVENPTLSAIGTGALPAIDHGGGLRVQPLFPTALGMADIGRLITKDEMDYIYSLEMGKNSGNLVSVERRVLDAPAMAEIRAFIEGNITRYLRDIMCGSLDVNLVITQSWVNVTQEGQFHHHHKHPNSVISGVFYPQATSDRDRIYFTREVGAETIRIDPVEFNTFNSSVWWIPVRTGALVLFPSGLHHKVEELPPGDERISLSFNTFPVGNVGNLNDLTGLYVGSVSDHSGSV